MKNIGIIFLLLLLNACQGEANRDMSGMSMAQEEAEYYDGEAQKMSGKDQMPLESERKLIKTVDIRFRVADLEQSSKKIELLTRQYSGYITGMLRRNNQYSIHNDLTIRIPAAELDAFLQAIEEESIYTDRKQVTTRDVTEEFLDISTRLETKKTVRDRYVAILRERAQSVEDILNAEEKIRVIQEEIESIEGRLKYLNNQTALSTVNVELYQEVEYEAPPSIHERSFLTKLKDGFVDGWSLILDLAVGLVSIWPIILIAVLLWMLRKRIRLFRKK